MLTVSTCTQSRHRYRTCGSLGLGVRPSTAVELVVSGAASFSSTGAVESMNTLILCLLGESQAT